MSLLMLLVMSCGCVFHPPAPLAPTLPALPDTWAAPHQITTADSSWLPNDQRIHLFNLIQEGLANNPQILAQRAEAEAAVQQAISAGADRLPSLSAALNGQRSHTESATATTTALSLDFLWEADLLGKLDDQARAATLAAERVFAEYEHACLQLAATLARSWFTLLESDDQVKLISEREDNLINTLALIEDGYHLGLKQPLDLFLARADLATTQARLEFSRQELGHNILALEQLLGRYPLGALSAQSPLPRNIPFVPVGLPATLLVHRPDIRGAGLALEAANLTTRAAWKARFPSFKLSGTLGNSSSTLSDLLSNNEMAWSFLAGLTAPLFDSGRLKARQEHQEHLGTAAGAFYTHTVLQALTEVERLLGDSVHQRQRRTHLADAVGFASRAEELAFEQYQQGLVDYVTVLESQRRTFDARTSLLAIDADLIRTRIDLLAALGIFPVSIDNIIQ